MIEKITSEEYERGFVNHNRVMPIHPNEKRWNERLRANEALIARLEYSMAAMESSLRRLWAAFSDLEEKEDD